MNAFQSLGLPALTTTAELRQVSELARVRRAMAQSSEVDVRASTVERLVSDPAYRLREAAQWYYDFGSTEAAAAADVQLNAHDATLFKFEQIATNAGEGRYNAHEFDEAFLAAVSMLENDELLPLVRLVEEIGDARLEASMVQKAVHRSVTSWVCKALFSIAESLGADNTRKAAERARDSDFTEEEDAEIAAQVLSTVASKVESVMAEHGAQIQSLIRRMAEDSSNDRELIRMVDALIVKASPWDALVDVFDDDLDVGLEGRVLDEVANLVRSAAVALVNHADEYDQSKRLLSWAEEIAQSPALKSKIIGEFQLLRYMAAHANFIKAAEANSWDEAGRWAAELQKTATTAEQKAEAATAAGVLAQRQSALSRAGAGGGCGSLIGALIAIMVVGGVIVAIATSGGEGGGSTADVNAPVRANPNSGPAAVDDRDSLDAESQAIDAERIKLDRAERQLASLGDEIDSLGDELDVMLALYPNGAPPNVVALYEIKRTRYNQLLGEYNDSLADYERDVNTFNRRVDAYNLR